MSDPRVQAAYEFSRILIDEYTQDQYLHREDAKAIVKVAKRMQDLLLTTKPLDEPITEGKRLSCICGWGRISPITPNKLTTEQLIRDVEKLPGHNDECPGCCEGMRQQVIHYLKGGLL
jgi:hypothetical protein